MKSFSHKQLTLVNYCSDITACVEQNPSVSTGSSVNARFWLSLDHAGCLYNELV